MRFLFCCCLFAALAPARTLTPVWLELGPDRVTLARVVIDGQSSCPELRVDGRPVSMQSRGPVPEGLQPVCEATIPFGARSLRASNQKLRLPKTPDRVAVIGDTGCRVKGGQIQACADPELWPFEQISEQVAHLKPDLIVHVGDYLYRESVCPPMVSGCSGPHGDTWETWNADFFQPAQAALAAAPWVFARGNHEDCERAHRGWFYYLDPRPFEAACSEYTEPYVAWSGTLRLGVLDTASTKDLPNARAEQTPIYADQLRRLSGKIDWLVDHHPFWGYTVKGGTVSPTQLTLGPAWELAHPEDVALILSGHVHLFEFLDLEGGRPNQLIAGDSGTQLDVGFTVDRSGASVNGARVKAGEADMSFGLTDIEREGSGWKLTLRNARGDALVTCALSRASCHTLSR